MSTAYFGGGCFWGVEAEFRKLDGVTNTAVGYMGGELDNPTYEQVCTDKTGHAEVVKIEFDDTAISYKELVEKFFAIHDPTQFNRQGPDIGSQYRSAIFVMDDEQREIAKEVIDTLVEQEKYDKDIVTTIEEASEFYIAEDYHQQYLEKRGLSTCHVNLSTKEH